MRARQNEKILPHLYLPKVDRRTFFCFLRRKQKNIEKSLDGGGFWWYTHCTSHGQAFLLCEIFARQ
jgi:hypothetical protein